MHVIKFPILRYFVRHLERPAALFLILIIAILGNNNVIAQPPAQDNNRQLVIKLSAPESIQGILDHYFELPKVPLVDETALHGFIHRAQREISELLATEGYFTPTILLKPDLPADTKIIEVNPGPRTLVDEIQIEFQGELADDKPNQRARIEQLRNAWPLKIGRPFRSSDWEEAKADLLSNVTQEDYAAAYIVKSHAIVDPEKTNAKLLVIINSGPVFYFGDLVVTGLDRYENTEVRNFAPFRTGDPYRRDALFIFQKALQNIRHFSSVTVSITPDITQHKAIPVQIVLTENKAKRIALGAGYSSNTGGRGELSYRNYNLLDRLWSLETTLRLEQKRQTFFAGVDTLPDQNNFKYGSGVRLQMTDIANLKTSNQRINFSRSYLTNTTQRQLDLSWQREEKRPAGGFNQTNQALALDWRWRYYSVDDPINVRRGSISEMQIGGASRQVLSDQDFLRTYARQQFWWPVGKRDVIYLRGEAGYTLTNSRSGIPQEFLFRAGGIQSVRGYNFMSLGVDEGHAVVGGRTLATGTLEYTHWMFDNWGGAIFADIGNAADNWKKFNPSLGYGAGARWRSPAGPLALDLARGHETGTLRLHFSIAVAF
ncbi:MAG: BamA/TamA family outer membrane protein [Nitrosomonas sp.]|nr:BamA/TamA family outer membrane protein [Nitrosomonas sp.]MDP1950622.1 BamA/TamA family outer membrane protein [Nitrosomonas sp.]